MNMQKNIRQRLFPYALILIRCLVLFGIVAIFLLNSLSIAGDKAYVTPAPRDKCPVCGMFAAKYPDWFAEVIYRDGTYRVFDGPKDMFKYLSDLKKYESSLQRDDIVSIYVSDYYSVHPIDAYQAFYVIGSNIYGPMGDEFIPFEKEADAREFLKDHAGKRILRYRDVTAQVLSKFN